MNTAQALTVIVSTGLVCALLMAVFLVVTGRW